MRYIGNKENILDKIYQILKDNGVEGKRFFDFFSGTTNVARFFKRKGYTVLSCDMLYLSYCLQKAYIENNKEPQFENLLATIPESKSLPFFPSPLEKVLAYLNTIPPVEGFIYQNYTPDGTLLLERPRMYFSSENGKKIDAIRLQIEAWKQENKIIDSEYRNRFFLCQRVGSVCCLSEKVGSTCSKTAYDACNRNNRQRKAELCIQ